MENFSSSYTAHCLEVTVKMDYNYLFEIVTFGILCRTFADFLLCGSIGIWIFYFTFFPLKALVEKCQQIKSVVFLDSPRLSDTTFKALAECKLVKVSIEG